MKEGEIRSYNVDFGHGEVNIQDIAIAGKWLYNCYKAWNDQNIANIEGDFLKFVTECHALTAKALGKKCCSSD